MKIITVLFIIAFTSISSFSQGFTSVFSKDGNDVIAVGNDYIFRSNDGGNSWGSTQVAGFSFVSVYAIGAKIWITTNPIGGVYYSTNNGVNWQTSGISGMTEVIGIFFIDANTGWVSGRNTIAK